MTNLPDNYVVALLTPEQLFDKLTVASLRSVCSAHSISLAKVRVCRQVIAELFASHECVGGCELLYTAFEKVPIANKRKTGRKYRRYNGKRRKVNSQKAMKKMLADDVDTQAPASSFPPPRPNKEMMHRIASNFYEELMNVREIGCAVCGELKPEKGSVPMRSMKHNLKVLDNNAITRKLRTTDNDPIQPLPGLVLAEGCDVICQDCRGPLRQMEVPRLALANNLWLGEVPPVLSKLRYFERILIQRVRHNASFVRVGGSFKKMIAHAICFPVNTPLVHDVLPPPREEMDEVLAVMFTGPSSPTPADYASGRFNPLLVRRKEVQEALEHLRLNSPDYADITISEENLRTYDEDSPPVTIEYRMMDTNINQESRSAFNTEDDQGVTSGEVPFVVHGLTGED
ncbi:uncharacterized protein SCHCODRAFT_02495151, partial [Schizophyllum commune H4-8]|uniref:uncharacterized protein n=1 Tax=Schizophyllum commune (strain H4-8 / FGSC 9210) TaxID=578458 RepID=UPI00215EF0BB